MREPGARLCFIGGAPRSGLTLLRRFLASHPAVRCGSDTGVPVAIVRQARDFARTLGSLHEKEFGLDSAAVRSIFGGLIVQSLGGTDRYVVCEKTAINIAVFEDLAAMLPAARFIHVVRDGRDVAASLLSRDWKDPRTGQPFDYVTSAGAAARYWASLAGIGLEAERAIGARVLRVRYEDMVVDAAGVLRAVARHLSVDPAEFAAHRTPASLSLSALESESLPLLLDAITTARIGAAKAALPPADFATVSEATAAMRARLGYA